MEPKFPQAQCEECPLRAGKAVPPRGPLTGKHVFVGESPGRDEAREGRPFVGYSGKLLAAIAGDLNDSYLTNTLMCFPNDVTEAQRDQAVQCCLPRLWNELDQVVSKDIILLGGVASGAILGLPKITKSNGGWVQKNGRNFIPLYHPAYVLRKPEEAATLIQDMAHALQGTCGTTYRLTDPPHYEVLDTLEAINNALGGLHNEVISFDFETSQNDWINDKVMLLAISTNDHHYVIPGLHPQVAKPMFYREDVAEALQSFVNANFMVAHNAKFDQHFGVRGGVNIHCDFDTMLAHYALDERKGTHGLKDLARRYFNMPDYEGHYIDQFLRSRNDRWTKVPFDYLAQYAVWDTWVTRELYFVFSRQLVEEGLSEWPYNNLLMKMSDSFFEMEELGMKVDVDHLERVANILEGEREEFRLGMGAMVGDELFNPRSHPQIAHAVWDVRQLPPPPKQKWDIMRGRVGLSARSTSKLALDHLAIKEGGRIVGYKDDFLELLFKYRRTDKILTSYIYNLINKADRDGRVHPLMFIHGTETGRISIKEPALQTLPRESTDKYGATVRSAFIPKEGYMYVLCDYSQGELRAFADITQDPFLLKVYRDGRDLHTEVSIGMYGAGYTKEHRMIVKRFNFGYIYGGGFSILQDAEMPKEAATTFLANYRKLMKRAEEWKKEQSVKVHKQGFIENLFKRRRRFPLITERTRIDAEHAAINAPVQSVVSDFLALAGIELQELGYRVLLPVHDSLVVEVPVQSAASDMEVICDVMQNVAHKWMPSIPWKADPEVVDRWAQVPEFICQPI